MKTLKKEDLTAFLEEAKNQIAMNSTILSLQQDYGLEKYVRYPGMTWT